MENEWDAVSDVVSDDEWNSVSEVVSEDEWGAVSSGNTQGNFSVPTGMSQQDQMVYDELKARSPQAYEQPQGRKPVDSPKFNFKEKNLEGFGQAATMVPNVVGGLYNIPRNVASTGLAASDYMTEQLFGYDPGRAESFESVVPEYEAENIGGNIVSGITEVTGGVGGALKIGKTVIQNAPSALKGLSTLILGEAGGVAASDIDTETIFPTLGQDEDGNFSEQLLLRRTQLLGEAMLLTKAGELAIRGGATALSIMKSGIKRLNTIGNEEAIAKEVANDLLNTLVDIKGTDTPEIIAQKKREIADILDKYGVVQHGNKTITRDSMTAIEKGLPPGRERDLAYARGMRTGTDSPELEARLAEPSRVIEETLFELETKAGGPAKADELAGQIQSDVKGQIKDAGKKVTQTERRLANTEKSLEEMLQNDVELGDLLKRLGNKTNIDITTGKNVKLDQIRAKINKASEKMTEQKNQYFKEIPDEAILDVDSIRARYTQEIPGEGPSVESLLSPETKSKFESLIGGAENEFDTINFNKLVRFADFDLSDEISRAAKNGDFGKAKELRKFRTNLVKDQLEFLRKSGQPGIAAKAEKAYGYYEEYASFLRDGKLEELQDIFRETKFRPLDQQYRQQQVLRSTLEDPNAAGYTEAIYDFMSRPDADASEKLLSDYVLTDVASTAQSIINRNGKFSTKEVNSLVAQLEKFVPILNKADPKQAKRFNKLVDAIRTKEFSAEELTKQLKEFQGNKAELEKELYSKYGDFFADYGLDKIPRTGQDAWTDVFKDKNIIPKLPDIIKQAKKNKNLDGLRAAYSKQFSDQLFRAQEMQGGAKKLNPLKDEDLNRFYQIGDELYKQTPEVMETVRGLIGEATSLSRSIGGKTVSGVDTSQFRKKASGVADFVITMVWGPLNRTGARIRSASGRILNATDPSDVARKITGEIMSNPEEFARLARQLAADDVVSFSPAQKKAVYKWLIGTGLYAGSEEEWRQAVEDTQTDTVFPEKE